MEHMLFFFIIIILLQKCLNNQLYPTSNPSTAEHQNISHFMNPNTSIQTSLTELPVTKIYLQRGKKAPGVRPAIYIKREYMKYTPPPFKIPYAVKTVTPVAYAKKIRHDIPNLSHENYTQLKKINFQRKTKDLTANELKNDERKTEEDRKIEEAKIFAEQSKMVDAKKKLQLLEGELEMKRELGKAELEPSKRELGKAELESPKRELSIAELEPPKRELGRASPPKRELGNPSPPKRELGRALQSKRELGRASPPKREFVIPKRVTNTIQTLPTKVVILKRETLKIQPPLLPKELPIIKPQSRKSDSSSEELKFNLFDDDRVELNYEIDADRELSIKW